MVDRSALPERVILAGLAGGLNPLLGIGDVLAQGEEVAGVRSGVIFTAEAIVATLEKKRELWRQTRADCVDLETGPIVEVCRRRGIPIASLRAISDSALECLPVPECLLVDPVTMRPSMGGICRHLIARPWKIPAFFRMVNHARLARKMLLVSLEAVLAPAKTPRCEGF